ncbi:hypothetical protein [Photobacterium phosphoreum]|uniref:hypothetical protein n=1 Tax=Photobacterium phosphoreum TaxID=659 RepID=UPI001E5B0F46|nr:hypothetical protein [Photobacterium phosphoreum]MCD9479347.1 hypothetical protein [Photobacterium phosphoreum]MCD9517818.1 hypothetical protein [Photobacterium phosphoreum]
MTNSDILNLVGLFFITLGSIFAALGAPAPAYNSDGSVSMSDEPNKKKRICKHYLQKNCPKFLLCIGFGAFLQAVAILFSSNLAN